MSMDMKLPKKFLNKISSHFKKHGDIHLAWLFIVSICLAIFMMRYLWKENQALKSTLLDSQQVLKQCQHTQGIWESQIDSGEIKILKRDGDTEIIERWELTKEPATDTWILK